MKKVKKNKKKPSKTAPYYTSNKVKAILDQRSEENLKLDPGNVETESAVGNLVR